MREERVDALGGLLGLQLVDGVFRFAAFFLDGEDAKPGDRFEGIARLGMQHAHADGKEISRVGEHKRRGSSNGDAFCERANGDQEQQSSGLAQ